MARPRVEISDEQLRQAEILAGYGLTQAQISDVLGVARRTFERKKDEPRVKAALEKGRAKAQLRMAKSIFEKGLDGDMTAAIWWEKTRAGRSEKVRVLVEQELERELMALLGVLEETLEPDDFRKAASALAASSGGEAG